MYAAYLYILRALSPRGSDRRLPHEEPRRPPPLSEERLAAAPLNRGARAGAAPTPRLPAAIPAERTWP
jgi:hypothetical protein